MLIDNRPRPFLRGLRLRVAALLCAGLALMLPTGDTRAQAAPSATGVVDHRLFDALLRRHVTNGFVDYDAFARAPEFPKYLAALDRVRLDSLSEDEQLAFWINVYNAYTIQLIVAHHETESIRNINRTFGVLRLKGPWSEPLVRAAGRRLTLDEVQHGILRKQFGEPRIHLALSCGAIGCPPLRSEAYTGASLVDQLDDQGRRFLRDSPTKNRVVGRRVWVSPILMAYRRDFGPAREDLGRFMAQYVEGDAKKLMQQGVYFPFETPFDWRLNSVAMSRRVTPPADSLHGDPTARP